MFSNSNFSAYGARKNSEKIVYVYIYDVLKNCCDWPSGSRDIKGAPIGEFIFFCQGGPLNPSNSGSRAGPFRCEKGVIT